MVESGNKNRALIDELKAIPHLPIERPFDHRSALKECESIDQWCGITLEAPEVGPQYLMELAEKYRGRQVRGVTNDSFFMTDTIHDVWAHPETRFSVSGRLKFQMTDLSRGLPTISNWLQSDGFPQSVSRVLRLSPGYSMGWHSHHCGPIYAPDYTHGILLTVIDTSEDFRNAVQIRNQPESKVEKLYTNGTTHLFNSWHDHAIFNHSVTPRFIIQHIVNLMDPMTLKFLRPSVASYRGPRLTVSSNHQISSEEKIEK